ncbi:MAG: hypothetical protein ABJN69_11590 [Hellea sp.]
MFESSQDLITFIRDFSNLANPPYKEPYLDEGILDNLERKLGKTLPLVFRKWLLLCNFDNLQLGTTMFGDGKGDFLDYVLASNTDIREHLKIASGEMGGIFISLKSGAVWSQYLDGEAIIQTKLAANFEGFFKGYAYLQKNGLEKIISLEEAAMAVAKKVGSDNYQVWLHSMN